MRVFLKSLNNKSIELRNRIKIGNLPEGEKDLQISILTESIKQLNELLRKYNKKSLKLLQDRNKDK